MLASTEDRREVRKTNPLGGAGACMIEFTSARERSLWLAASGTVLAIYASLPFLGIVARFLRSEGALGVTFALGFALAILATVLNGLRRDARARELWIGLGVVAVYLAVFARLGVGPAERTHLFEYGLVAVLIYEALRERSRKGRGPGRPAVVAVLAGAALGWLDESIQLLLPSRVYDLRDVGVNALAALVAVLATLALRWARGGGRSDA